ncbi:hypothetical protein [Xenorhabdus sp. PB62.4]|uniref:hypothetical protein n=1 Tax=Xenorhabdus sp. PB62.4 TaxID=1851573 RepID=UPI0016570F58|nr:hypothetical protein [Xenorhabdus sp. PB62.4]MBC8953252.1 hypothetical protein [Xenorhabdus sp. PB62.4]
MSIEINNNFLISAGSSIKIQPIIPDGADVIIGQECYLRINIEGNKQDILSIESVDILNDPNNNFTISQQSGWVVNPNGGANNVYSGKAVFVLQVSDQITDGKSINYTVYVKDKTSLHNTIAHKEFTYKVNDLEQNKIIPLKAQPEFLDLLTTDNVIGKTNKYFTVSGVITKNDNTTPLKHTQIVISTVTAGQLNSTPSFVNIRTDEKTPQVIEVISQDQQDSFFVIKSDEDGKISFRVYPIKDISVRIDFTTQILNSTEEQFATSIYVFKSEKNPFFGLWHPIILGLEVGGILKQILGTREFQVKVTQYTGYQDTDDIVFYLISGPRSNQTIERLEPVFKLRDIESLSAYRFSFPYDKLKLNKPMALYYMVIPQDGKPRYSTAMGVTYVGGEDVSPTDDTDRIYDKPKIYSSYTTQNAIDPTSYDDEVSEYGAVTLDTIEQQKLKNATLPNPQPIKDIPGLYVVVQGTKKPNDPNSNSIRPLLGSKPLTGQVGVYLTSRTRKNHNHYTFQLPDLTASKDFTVVPIPFCALNRAAGYHSGAEGTLYIEYSIDDGNGTLTYSKVWQVDLDTIELGQDLDDRNGCPAETNS